MKTTFTKACILLIFLTLPSVALAQENSAYSPRKLAPAEVIVPLTYSDSPLTLPFQELSRKTEKDGNYFNYVLEFGVAMEDVVNYFADAKKHGKKLPILNLQAVKYSDSNEVEIVGSGTGSKVAQFAFSVEGKPYHIQISISSTPNGTTIVTIPGLISSTIFSGAMPVRASFKPLGSPPIPFRWN